MLTEYSIDKIKLLTPINNSRWFYLFFTIGLIINYFLFNLIGIVIMFALFGILIVFHIILHFQYYLHDKKIKLVIDYGNRTIKYIKDNQTTNIPFEDIQIIQRYKGSRYANVFDSYVIPSNFYNWTMIKTKNGLQYSFSDFIKEDLNIYGIRRQEKIVPFFNSIRN
jgi:hypothetical protein